MFLWENGADAILWFGPQVDPHLLQAIMGASPKMTRRAALCHSRSGSAKLPALAGLSFQGARY